MVLFVQAAEQQAAKAEEWQQESLEMQQKLLKAASVLSQSIGLIEDAVSAIDSTQKQSMAMLVRLATLRGQAFRLGQRWQRNVLNHWR